MKRTSDAGTSESKRPRFAGDDEEYAVDHEELHRLERVVGISSFSSTKGKDHTASGAYGVMKVAKRKVREALRARKEERKKKKIKRQKI